MKHYCPAETPPCFQTYRPEDEPESVPCVRQRCPLRNLLTARRAYERSTVSVPSLSRMAAHRKGGA